jgi:DNA polymerase-3 subunit delta'
MIAKAEDPDTRHPKPDTRLIGHAEAAAWLRRVLATDRLAHAYLITGPRSVGRRTFALEIARAVNCLAPEVEARPDHTCQQCRLIERNVHPDVRIVRRAPEKRTILLRPPTPPGPQRDFTDNVEFIQADAQLRPLMGRKKVYVILNAEELAQDAGDRLLKTLEEPPPFVLFLLTAVERGAVFPTIVSRCQEVRLRPAARPDLARALVGLGADEAHSIELAALAGGRQGWAVAALRDPRLFEQQQAYVQEFVAVLGASRVERLVSARRLSELWAARPEVVRETLRAWLAWWRDVVLHQLGLGGRVRSVGDTPGAIARQLNARQVRDTADNLQRALMDLDMNVNARLVLDLLLLKLPRADWQRVR